MISGDAKKSGMLTQGEGQRVRMEKACPTVSDHPSTENKKGGGVDSEKEECRIVGGRVIAPQSANPPI